MHPYELLLKSKPSVRSQPMATYTHQNAIVSLKGPAGEHIPLDFKSDGSGPLDSQKHVVILRRTFPNQMVLQGAFANQVVCCHRRCSVERNMCAPGALSRDFMLYWCVYVAISCGRNDGLCFRSSSWGCIGAKHAAYTCYALVTAPLREICNELLNSLDAKIVVIAISRTPSILLTDPAD